MKQKKVIRLELTAEQYRDYHLALTQALKVIGMAANQSPVYASLMGTIGETLFALRTQLEISSQQPGPGGTT